MSSCVAVCPHAPPDGYVFEPKWNSVGNDLNQAAADKGTWLGKVPELAAACNGNSLCAGE